MSKCPCGRHFVTRYATYLLCHQCRRQATKEGRCKGCGIGPQEKYGWCLSCHANYEREEAEFERTQVPAPPPYAGKFRTGDHMENTHETKYGGDR